MTSIKRLHRIFLTSTGVCTDTRQVNEGAVFFALKGPNFNANSFALQALEKGCAHVVVDEAPKTKDKRITVVPDALRALQDLATFHRRRFDIPVIGITGSNGKTTTKELLHAVLSADRPTLSTTGNLNNHIGVPLTLLRITSEHHAAIIEMGANKPGDIAELCAIAEPGHGLITNVGRAHLEGFGDLEGVIRTKTELFAHIRRVRGQLYVNADDPVLMDHSAGMTRITYGTNELSTWRGRSTGKGHFLEFAWEHVGVRSGTVRTKLIGAYNLGNAMAAVCIGGTLGVTGTTMAKALEAYSPGNNRSQFLDTGKNHVVLDAYNANPTSMRAALEHFSAMVTEREKLVVLGGMKELGGTSSAEHKALVELLSELGSNAMLVGPEFEGMEAFPVFPDADSALAALEEIPITNRLILLKGSRGTALEKILPAL